MQAGMGPNTALTQLKRNLTTGGNRLLSERGSLVQAAPTRQGVRLLSAAPLTLTGLGCRGVL